jgi:hypothetical protein
MGPVLFEDIGEALRRRHRSHSSVAFRHGTDGRNAADVTEEVSVSWNTWVRQIHRWLAIAFTVTVIANFIAMAQGDGTPPPWVTYSPLLPLALLLFTGLYLFVLPYVTRRHSTEAGG